MAHCYVANLAGCKLSDDNMRKIPTPRLEMHTHITLKGIQGGAFIGGLVAAPIACAVKGELNKKALLDKSYTYGVNGVKIGAVVGTLMHFGWYLSAKPDGEGYYDRCYRLRYNRNQVFSDRMCIVGMAAGAGIASYLGEELGKGVYFGFTGGLLAAGIFNTVAGMF